MDDPRYMSAAEAAAALNISRSTLYSYVSRGLIRSEPVGGRSRAHRYHAADVEALRRRQEARHDPQAAARQALNWGEPVLASGVTLIEDGHFYYRGRNAVELARTRTLETVAGLLWEGETPDLSGLQEAAQDLESASGYSPFAAFQIALAGAEGEDLGAYDRTPAGVRRTGARILHLLTRVATGRSPCPTIAAALRQAWLPRTPPRESEEVAGSDDDARDLISRALDAALILCADHELNASSFAARVIAATGATPYAAVIGGLAALSGPRHGGVTEQVQALLRDAEEKGAREAVFARLRRGESVPGFGHPLYPDGDPRAKVLQDVVEEMTPNTPVLDVARELTDIIWESARRRPSLDFGLVLLARALELPSNAPRILFALGRTVGWIAHTLEQYGEDRLIRPRAHYVGRRPIADG